MTHVLTAQDLWPLIKKLSHTEQMRLAKLALREAAETGARDADAYAATPPHPDEFGEELDALGWDADGWSEFDASR